MAHITIASGVAFIVGAALGLIFGHHLSLNASRAFELLHADAGKWENRCKMAESRASDIERRLRARCAPKGTK